MNSTTLSAPTFWVIEITLLIAIAVACILIHSLRKNTLFIKNLHEVMERNEAEEERFNGEQAEKWFEKGELKMLDSYCERYIKDSPNSVHANWYYALSHYNQGDYEIAREYFENVIHINPLWRDGAMVYLQEIANKIGIPENRTLH